MSNGKPREPVSIEVPEDAYQPTRAELEEAIKLDARGMTFAQAMRRILRPVSVRKISAAVHRSKRSSP